MFIIVEGPDGAGKSTFVKELCLALWRKGRGTVLVNPKRSPNQSPIIEYKTRLDFYRPNTGLDLILDRCWYSDDVYGPVWRGKGLDFKDRKELENWAMSLGAVMAILDQPDEVLAERLAARGDPDVSPEDVAQYAATYRNIRGEWNLEALVNPTVQQIILLASSTEGASKGRR